MDFLPKACNLELTTACPLKCKQCYCSLTGGKHLDRDLALKRIHEAADLGVKLMHLSGGETMCYPYLFDLIHAGSKLGIQMDIATSGYKINHESVKQLKESGIGRIYISLNGSTNEINSLTRDGYELAIQALSCLQKEQFGSVYINWVMHANNAHDFSAMIAIAEKYDVAGIVVLSFKPDANHMLPSYPSGDQIRDIATQIKSYKGKVTLAVETCFSPLLAVIKDTTFLGNINTGPYKGCGAGRLSYNTTVDGQFSPCRHLDYFEYYETTREYWENSEILKKLRAIEDDTRSPCAECRYKDYCRHCAAINSKLHQELYIGLEICDLGKE